VRHDVRREEFVRFGHALFPLFYLVEIRHWQLLQSQSRTRSRTLMRRRVQGEHGNYMIVYFVKTAPRAMGGRRGALRLVGGRIGLGGQDRGDASISRPVITVCPLRLPLDLPGRSFSLIGRNITYPSFVVDEARLV